MSWIREKGLASLVAELEREEPHLDFGILRSTISLAKEPAYGLAEDEPLALSVLEDGIRSYLSPTKSVAKSAEKWVYSRKHHSFFSFVDVCERLGLDSGVVRKALKHLREQMDTTSQK